MGNLHAHMESRSRDCDGDYSAGHVYEMTILEQAAPFGDLEFKYRVVSHTISIHGHGTLTVTPEGVSWYEDTEEGYRAIAVRWCENECENRTWQRDHRAEEAGY